MTSPEIAIGAANYLDAVARIARTVSALSDRPHETIESETPTKRTELEKDDFSNALKSISERDLRVNNDRQLKQLYETRLRETLKNKQAPAKPIPAPMLQQSIEPPINPALIYCQKTGQPIGAMNETFLQNTLRDKGFSYLKRYLIEANLLSVAPNWHETNEKALDALYDKDAIAYCVYCLAFATNHFYQHNRKTDNDIGGIGAQRYWALVRSWYILSTMTKEQTGHLKTALCRLLTYAPDTLRYLFRTKLGQYAKAPDKLAQLAIRGELIDLLNSAINSALNHTRDFQMALNRPISQTNLKRLMYESIPKTIKDAARGPSQIRKQKASKKLTEYDKLMAEFGDTLDDIALPELGKETWRKAVSRVEETETEFSDDEIDALGDDIFGADDLKDTPIIYSHSSTATIRKPSAKTMAEHDAFKAEETQKARKPLPERIAAKEFAPAIKPAPQKGNSHLLGVLSRLKKGGK